MKIVSFKDLEVNALALILGLLLGHDVTCQTMLGFSAINEKNDALLD